MKQNLKKMFIFTAVGTISGCLLFFIIISGWIGYEVNSTCQTAQRQYAGDCVTSLISLLEDEKQGFGDRNRAIWSLGQYGDQRALPVLEKYYTGQIPDREPLDSTISQYELKKAVNLTSGGTNISAFIWRNFFDLWL